MAMSADFLAAYAKLPAQQQRGVRAMISRFGRASKASGLNYEKIANATDPSMRSLRIDGGYRAIVLKPAHGMVHVLLWADKHDDAYAWATRHACSINPETGALQVYEPRFEPQPVEASAPRAEVATLFGTLKRRELLRLGVPDEMVAEVHTIRTEAELDSMSARLPVEAYEGLFLYLAGDTYEQIIRDRESPASVDVEDFDAALRREDSKVRFVVIENDLALEEMLNAPLERWRVFLHPSQRRLVERDWNGPVRVLGGAGTGKTVVAMHRARWLAQRLGDGGRILFTTFTRNLAADLEYNLRSICSPEEMKCIKVTNLDRWVQRFLRGRRYRFRPVFSRDDGAWRAALGRQPTEPAYSERFYEDEWEQVIQANAVTTREEYLRIPRTGRGVRINRAARAAIWPVFEEYRARLAERGVMEVADCYRAAAALLAQDADYRFDAVIVDEAQDLSAPAWQLIRALAPNERNDLFITGDAHQRIYSRTPATLGRLRHRHSRPRAQAAPELPHDRRNPALGPLDCSTTGPSMIWTVAATATPVSAPFCTVRDLAASGLPPGAIKSTGSFTTSKTSTRKARRCAQSALLPAPDRIETRSVPNWRARGWRSSCWNRTRPMRPDPASDSLPCTG